MATATPTKAVTARSPLPSELRRNANLLRELAVTQFKLKYAGSVLGYVWSLLKPLLYFGVLYTVFVSLLKVGSNSPHFALQLLLGIVLWTFFAETTGSALSSIVGNGHMIRKAYFPRVIPVLAATVTSFMTFVINVVLLVVIGSLIGQTELGFRSVLLVPLVVELYLLVIGVSLILSSLFVFFRDVGHLWEVFSQVLFYGSAVLFPFSLVHGKVTTRLLASNPVAQIIEDARRLVITDSPTIPYAASVLGPELFWAPFVAVGVVLGIGVVIFRRLSPRFAESI